MDRGLTATLRASGHRMLIAMPHASVPSRLTATLPVSARSSRHVITHSAVPAIVSRASMSIAAWRVRRPRSDRSRCPQERRLAAEEWLQAA
jgi:hypothetical protein